MCVMIMKLYQKLFLKALLVFTFVCNVAIADIQDDVQNLINQGEFESALEMVNQGIKDNKKDERLNMQKGFILVQMAKYDEAVKYYKKMIRRWKKNPEPMNNLGVVYRLQHNYADSIEVLRDAIKKFPEYRNVYENLGDTYIQMAKDIYQDGVDQNENDLVLNTKLKLTQNFDAITNQNIVAFQNQQQQQATQQQTQTQQTETPEQQANRINNDVMRLLQSWTDAWVSKVPGSYFLHYSKEYVPQGGLGIADWVERKTQIFNASEFIKIALNNINIEFISPTYALVSFEQHYKSDFTHDVTNKQLGLTRYDEGWLITSEKDI